MTRKISGNPKAPSDASEDLKIRLRHLENDFALTRKEYEDAAAKYLVALAEIQLKNAEHEALRKNLEIRVQERTAMLASANLALEQEIAKQRLALDSKTQGAQAAQYGAEARLKGVQANAAEQLAALQNRYMTAKPEEQAAIAKQIQTLSGKTDKTQLHTVNQPDTMAPDGMTKLGGGQRLVVQGADGSFHEVPVGGGQAAGISADARAIAIRDNKSMSVDEKRKQLQALGYK